MGESQIKDCLIASGGVPIGVGGNLSPLSEGKSIFCR